MMMMMHVSIRERSAGHENLRNGSTDTLWHKMSTKKVMSRFNLTLVIREMYRHQPDYDLWSTWQPRCEIG